MTALRSALAPLRPFRARMALAALLGTLTLLAAAGLLTTSGYLIARAAQRPEVLSLIVAVTSVRAFALVRALARYGERLVSHDVAFRALAAQRRRVFAGLARLAPDTAGGGDLLARFVGDVDRLQDLYLRALAPPLVALLAGVATVVAAALLLPAAGLALAAGLLVAGTAVPALAAGVAARAGRRQAGARAGLTTLLVEGLDGAEELAVAGRQRDWLARIADAGRSLVALQRRDALAGALATGAGGVVAGATVAAVAALGVSACAAGDLSGVALAAVVLLALGAFDGVLPLGAAARTLRGCLDAAARVDAVATREPAVADPADPVPVPAHGDLRAAAVVVRLPAGDGERVLGPFELTVAPGRAVALAGPSGCGKSTLAALLVRFRDPDAGLVSLGGVDARRLRQADLRAAVRLADQSAHLFASSLRANLRLARPEAGDDELAGALEAVDLGDWLATLPDGLGTLVGEHGAAVSGGQRSRIAAARILLARPRFAVFDEPAAHLDADAARELHATLAALAHETGMGVLVITHAAEGLEAFDDVVRC